MAVQIRNSQMVDLLTADFIRRNEPAPYLGRVISTYQSLPQLRGFWPFSSVDENSDPYDLSMQGRTLTNNNSVTYGTTDFLPYAEFSSASTQSLSRPDEPGLDITGNLTVGVWAYLTALVSQRTLINRFTGTNNRQFQLGYAGGSNSWFFTISQNGTAIDTELSSVTPTVNEWIFIVGRYDGSNIAVQVNGTLDETSTALTSLFNSNQDFVIGDRPDGGSALDGRIALPFICATNLSNALLSNLYQQSRVLFGV